MFHVEPCCSWLVGDLPLKQKLNWDHDIKMDVLAESAGNGEGFINDAVLSMFMLRVKALRQTSGQRAKDVGTRFLGQHMTIDVHGSGLGVRVRG